MKATVYNAAPFCSPQNWRVIARVFSNPVALVVLITACSGDKPKRMYPQSVEQFQPIPELGARQPPSHIDSPINLLVPKADSVSLCWLRFAKQPRLVEADQPEMLQHIFTRNDSFFLTTYFPSRQSGVFVADSGYKHRLITYKTGDTIECSNVGRHPTRCSYILSTGKWIQKEQHYEADTSSGNMVWVTSFSGIERIPSLEWENENLSTYANRCLQNDGNTFARFFGTHCNRIYFQNEQWYMAEYSRLSLTGINLMKRSNHTKGARFDLADLTYTKGMYNAFRKRDAIDMGLDPEEDFKKYVNYYVIGDDGVVSVFNLADSNPEYTTKALRPWRYDYSYFDSVFYFGGTYVERVFGHQ